MTPDKRGRGRKGRPRDDRRGGGDRSYGRRNPPPEATGAQSAFLDAVLANRRTVVACTRDGETLRGIVVEHSAADITIEDGSGQVTRVRHVDLRTLHLADD